MGYFLFFNSIVNISFGLLNGIILNDNYCTIRDDI